MNIVLCGQLTNAFTANVNRFYEEDRWFPRDEGYYASLFRHTDRSYFDRAASLIAIAEVTAFDRIDWAVPEISIGDSLNLIINDPNLEIDTPYAEIEKFVSGLLENQSISSANYSILSRGGTEPNIQNNDEKGRQFAKQQLQQMIQELLFAGRQGFKLAVTEDDESILREISKIILSTECDVGFEFPNFEEVSVVNDTILPPAIINFSPSDITSLAAVKADKLVKRYSAEVDRTLALHDNMKKHALVQAMREASELEGRISAASTVIEFITTVVRALHIPLVGLALGAEGHILRSEREKRSWHLIRVRMTEVSLRDYLKRSSNF